MNELIRQIEATIKGQGLMWLVRSSTDHGGYFANICHEGTPDNPVTAGSRTYPGTGPTPERALRSAFISYKRSLS